MRPSLWGLALLAAGALAPPARAQFEQKKEPERLFRSREPLDLQLIGPLRTLFKNRDTVEKKPETAQLLIKREDGGWDTTQVRLETRGHFRLKPSTCRFPPIKVYFDKPTMRETPFRSQGSLKLATHCQDNDKYEQNLLIEESIYRLYNLLTPMSYFTRLARIRYVPTEDTTKVETRWAFFLEDDDEVAKRMGGVEARIPGLALSDMDPLQLDMVSVFQYMVANTDWSIYALHNYRILQFEGVALGYPVPYDFDFAGLVSAPYSGPDPRLPIKSVRTRLYRGVCRKYEELIPVFQRFLQVKDAVFAVYDSIPGLDPKRAKQATDYLEDFFEDIDPPKNFHNALGYACQAR